ncbi:Uncharacterised protein [Streptococcus pneumoniae]|nr:Uncharacterised protein [Streptococcus pneumoniae]
MYLIFVTPVRSLYIQLAIALILVSIVSLLANFSQMSELLDYIVFQDVPLMLPMLDLWLVIALVFVLLVQFSGGNVLSFDLVM